MPDWGWMLWKRHPYLKCWILQKKGVRIISVCKQNSGYFMQASSYFWTRLRLSFSTVCTFGRLAICCASLFILWTELRLIFRAVCYLWYKPSHPLFSKLVTKFFLLPIYRRVCFLSFFLKTRGINTFWTIDIFPWHCLAETVPTVLWRIRYDLIISITCTQYLPTFTTLHQPSSNILHVKV